MSEYEKNVCSRAGVPSCFHQNFVDTGYRRESGSILTCLRSAFWPTNETFNFWTHFVASIMLMSRTGRIIGEFENPFEAVHLPFYIHSFGSCYLLVVSSFAHLFCCYSERCCHRCFAVDQAAVVLYALCVLLGFEHLTCPMSCYGPFNDLSRAVYMGCVVILTVLHTIFSVQTSHSSYSPALRSLPCTLMTLLIILPCIVRFTMNVDEPGCFPMANKSYEYFAAICFLAQTLFISLGGFFFSSCIPERFYPGKYDIIGNSHQLFHICSALAMYFQNLLIEHGLNEAKNVSSEAGTSGLSITWSWTVGVYSLVFILSHTVVLLHDRWGRNEVKAKSS
ncbi:membrane progestin receptor gamma-like [Ciona intestinalis]